MENKTTYDVRGGQRNLKRQLSFNRESFIHMAFYRVLIIVSIISFFVFLLGFWFAWASRLVDYLVVLVWILFIPQIFAFLKGISMVGSKGIEFGHLNESYASALKVDRNILFIYRLAPYITTGIFVFGLGLFILGVLL